MKSYGFPIALLLAALSLQPMQAQAAPDKQAKNAPKAAHPTPTPTAAEIADAKSKGLVWVNLGTGVYHKDGEFFGKTKRGKFMAEADATKAGYRSAKASGIAKKAKAETKTK